MREPLSLGTVRITRTLHMYVCCLRYIGHLCFERDRGEQRIAADCFRGSLHFNERGRERRGGREREIAHDSLSFAKFNIAVNSREIAPTVWRSDKMQNNTGDT